jgi:signal transduction histidine kinase
VRYVGVPVTLEGHPGHGVVVAAYFVDQERAVADKASRLMAGAGAGAALLAALAAWAVAGRILRPVREVAATARAITETDLSARIPTLPPKGPRDEIGQVVEAVNAMLDRVEAGIRAQRRFVDDASHELRTPITIIRGHLDVVDLNDGADVRSTLALVDDELSRMNRIVSDLLVLAKADQPEFVRLELTDVRSLLIETLAKAEGLANREWSLSQPAMVTMGAAVPRSEAMLDAQRVAQALLVLADNAARHTDMGDSITFGATALSTASGEFLRLWVSDSGVGVPVADRSRIFERFARGSASRRSEGAGLGLAIASAIAAAHGGKVEITDGIGARLPSRPGATFTLVIPQYGADFHRPQDAPPATSNGTEPIPVDHDESRRDEQHLNR